MPALWKKTDTAVAVFVSVFRSRIRILPIVRADCLSVRFLQQLLLGNFKFCHAMPHRSIATCSMQLVRSTNSRFKRCWYSCTVYYYCPTRQFMMDAPSTNMQPKRGHDDGADFLASCILRLHEPLPKLSRKHRIVDQALRNADQLAEFIHAAFRRVAQNQLRRDENIVNPTVNLRY